MVVGLYGFDSLNFVSGFADNISFECGSLLEPLFSDGGNASHAIVVFELSLGAAELSFNDFALGVEGDLRLDGVDNVSKKLAVFVNSNSCELGVHVGFAVFFSSSGGSFAYGRDSAEAELELVSGELSCTVIVASFGESVNESGDVHGAACIKGFVNSYVVTVLFFGFKSSDFSAGLADYELAESFSLLIPLFADRGYALHAIVFFFLFLGAGIEGCTVYNAIGDCKLVLCNIKVSGNDFALCVKNDSSNGCINLCIAGFRGFGAYGNAHAELVGSGSGFGFRDFALRFGFALGFALIVSRLIVACCEGKNHYESEEKCKKFFHNNTPNFLFLCCFVGQGNLPLPTQLHIIASNTANVNSFC